MNGIYWALIGDVIQSRRISRRATFQEHFEKAVQEVNLYFGEQLASRGVITTGDEVQYLFFRSEPLPHAVDMLCQFLSPYKMRFGIGHGVLSTDLKPEAIGMDGPAWRAARFALERARKDRKRVIVAVHEEILQPVSDIWDLALCVAMKRTPKQQEIVRLFDKMKQQRLVASHLGLDHSVVSRHLKKALYWEVKRANQHIPELLEKAVR